MIEIIKPANSEITEMLNFSCSYCTCEYKADNRTFFNSVDHRKKIEKGDASKVVFAKCPYCGQENSSKYETI